LLLLVIGREGREKKEKKKKKERLKERGEWKKKNDELESSSLYYLI